jgi:hypothetical protein
LALAKDEVEKLRAAAAAAEEAAERAKTTTAAIETAAFRSREGDARGEGVRVGARSGHCHDGTSGRDRQAKVRPATDSLVPV